MGHIVLTPVRASPADFHQTLLAVQGQQLPLTVVPVDLLVEHVRSSAPTTVVLHGGRSPGALQRLVREVLDVGSPGPELLVLVEGLNLELESALVRLGVSDVLEVPISPQRLQARVVARHMRALSRSAQDQRCVRGPLIVDFGRREVAVDGSQVHLTRTEFDLLAALLRHPRRVLTRGELSEGTPSGSRLGSRALETHVSRVRTKIVEAGGPRLIEAVRGVGYRLGAC